MPPAMTTSARPDSIISAAVPIASSPEAHAVETVSRGPCRRQRRAICPAAMLGQAWMLSLRGTAWGALGVQQPLGLHQGVGPGHRGADDHAGPLRFQVRAVVLHRLCRRGQGVLGEEVGSGPDPLVDPAGRVEGGDGRDPGVASRGRVRPGSGFDDPAPGVQALGEGVEPRTQGGDDTDTGDGDLLH